MTPGMAGAGALAESYFLLGRQREELWACHELLKPEILTLNDTFPP